jgi:Flp pilus assembly protein TadG
MPRPAARRPHSQTDRHTRRGGNDSGSTIVELVIVFPALLLCVMMTIEFGIWMHARHLAQAAADDGLTQTQRLDSTADQGQAEAQTQLRFLAGSMLTDPTITATRDATTATVTVDATAISVLPFFTLTVHERVSGPVERFVPAPGGFANSDVSVGGNSRVGGAP